MISRRAFQRLTACARSLTSLSPCLSTYPSPAYWVSSRATQRLQIGSLSRRTFSSKQEPLSALDYEHVAEETLESLTTYFDDLLEVASIQDGDVMYSVCYFVVLMQEFKRI